MVRMVMVVVLIVAAATSSSTARRQAVRFGDGRGEEEPFLFERIHRRSVGWAVSFFAVIVTGIAIIMLAVIVISFLPWQLPFSFADVASGGIAAPSARRNVCLGASAALFRSRGLRCQVRRIRRRRQKIEHRVLTPTTTTTTTTGGGGGGARRQFCPPRKSSR